MTSSPDSGHAARFMLACLSLSCAVPLTQARNTHLAATVHADVSLLTRGGLASRWATGNRSRHIRRNSAMRTRAASTASHSIAVAGMLVSRTTKSVCCACTMLPRVSTSTSNYSYRPTAGRRTNSRISSQTTRDLKAQLHVDGKPVLSAYAAGGKGFTDSTATRPRSREPGCVLRAPLFSGHGRAPDLRARSHSGRPNVLAVRTVTSTSARAGAPDLIAKSTEALSGALKTRGKVFMAPVTPYYRGLPAGTNYRAFETSGFPAWRRVGSRDRIRRHVGADRDLE